MPKEFTHRDFLLKDITVTLGSGRSGAFLPADDTQPPPSPISPIAVVFANVDLFVAVRGAVLQAVQEKRFDDIGRAFVANEAGGSSVIRTAIQEIGTAVVAGAAYAAVAGTAGMPDPDSDAPIPHHLSPVVNVGRAMHRISDLPKLQRQLAETVAYIDKVAASHAPRGAEVATVRTHLEGALKSLSAAEAAKA
jgi:hypothetical protein